MQTPGPGKDAQVPAQGGEEQREMPGGGQGSWQVTGRVMGDGGYGRATSAGPQAKGTWNLELPACTTDRPGPHPVVEGLCTGPPGSGPQAERQAGGD